MIVRFVLWCVLGTACLVLVSTSGKLSAGDVSLQTDESTGWDVYTLRQGATQVRVVPAAGANAYSMIHEGVEYFRVPDELKKLPGVGYGNPILYPMPNRVQGATFTFEGKTFEFPKNGRGNFIHGLVHSESFTVESSQSDQDSATLVCRLDFSPGSKPYQSFPLEHAFRISITVREARVSWTYQVDNRGGECIGAVRCRFSPLRDLPKLPRVDLSARSGETIDGRPKAAPNG